MRPTTAPRTVCAVLVSWNSMAFLPRCLETLRAQTVIVEPIIAVDNGSTDGSTEWLRAQPDITLVANPINVGFAAANNQALKLAPGSDLVLLVNADVDLPPDYVELCAARFEDPEVGSVTGKLLRAVPAGTIDSTGHNVFWIGWAENRGEDLPDRGYDEAGEVFGVCAAAALYRRAALDSVAIDGEYFDESFVNYIEDVDLDWRLRWLGWRAWYEPAAVAIHHRSATGARFTAGVMRHILKNRILTVAKNYDRRSLLTHLPGILFFTAVKVLDFGRVSPAAALGVIDAARLMPTARRRARWLRARRRASREEVVRLLRPFPWRGKVARLLLRRRRRPGVAPPVGPA